MKIVELRQDRSLIRNNFDGYKLSLDAVPVLRQDLGTAPYKAEPNSEQYSLLHVELFSCANLLQPDPWARNTAYHVNRLGEVIRNGYDENTGRPEPLQVVFRLGGIMREKGDYNYSMRFVSEKYCVLCDGIEKLLLLDTGDRLKKVEWKEVSTAAISLAISGSGDVKEEERGFTIFDSRLDIVQEQKRISLALGRVQRVESTTGCSSHCMRLYWAKWLHADNWIFSIAETLEGKGSLYYCAFEPRGESLILSSNRQYSFYSVSAEQAKSQLENEANTRPQLHAANGESTYSWMQTDDEIVVKFNVQQTYIAKNDYNIKNTSRRLTVKYLDDLLLDSELNNAVDNDLTTWTIENNFLQVTLIKQNSTLFWPTLLADGSGPKESLENGDQNSLPVEQQPIANLEAPIEDCDFPISGVEDDNKIERFHLPSKTVTHTVLLGTTPPLFATNLRAGFPNAIATRQDVDASLWLQQYISLKPDDWCMRHEGNLHAFGYIQASKQQKKYMDCSPDLNYAIICESYRHVFLYKSQYDTANGLRNRNGPQITIGKQHLITLPDDVGEVVGITAAPNVAILLTEKSILYLQMS